MAGVSTLHLLPCDQLKLRQPPTPVGEEINLVIAVSFGLLIPPRILGRAKYGGLNVHPSLLPEYDESLNLPLPTDC